MRVFPSDPKTRSSNYILPDGNRQGDAGSRRARAQARTIRPDTTKGEPKLA
ncbi:hypothetical protein BJ960_001400 [Leucobacter aridicollis]|uniref:Uncharacterized protein n=1 Tax=Leucobacter aridicollis TaxID=283878 RepID=A0A852R1W2_9MICO|nr:hypothetical protein [Leucobacter aridicollis]